MNKSSKIGINASSLVDLKAELFRKQDQLKKDRLGPQGSSTSSARSKQQESKKPSIWSKKNAGVTSRAEKDLEQIEQERNELENARNKLEAKAKFYEQMTKDGYIPEADSGERFLVDFEKKALDHSSEDRGQRSKDGASDDEGDVPPPANADEEWVDYTDTLGRCRRCMRKDLPNLISMDKNLNRQIFDKQKEDTEEKKEDLPDLMSNDMYREMLRKKWEEEEEAAAKGPLKSTHYQNVKYDEVRDMGVGYFDFSKDKTQRNEQMETLQLLRDETLGQRQRREKLKEKRKATMKARLEKVKEKKRQRGELIEEDEKEEEKEEGEEEAKKKKREDEDDELQRLAEERDGKPPKESTVREWDIGKEVVSPWEQRLGSLREERPSEFAPPSLYSGSGQKRGHHQQKSSYPPPKDYSLSHSDWKEKAGNKSSNHSPAEFAPSSDSSSSQESGHRTKMNLPPPKDFSAMYGRPKEKTGQKSASASFSHWTMPIGSSGSSQPFVGGGVSDSSSRGGTGGMSNACGQKAGTLSKNNSPGKDDGSDAIASALSYFRKNVGK